MKTFCKCSATLVPGLIALMDCVSVSCPRRAAWMACRRRLAVFWLSFTSPLPQPVENIDKGSSHSPTEPWHGPGSQHQSTEFSSWNKFTCQPHSRRIMALMRNVTKCPRGEDAFCDKVVQGQSSSPGERLATQPVTFFRCGLFFRCGFTLWLNSNLQSTFCVYMQERRKQGRELSDDTISHLQCQPQLSKWVFVCVFIFF